jgi:hypothetical protein
MALCECKVEWDDKTCVLRRCPMHDAAPEMLEALRELLRESDKGKYQDTRPIAWAHYRAQEAIAKAEGHT